MKVFGSILILLGLVSGVEIYCWIKAGLPFFYPVWKWNLDLWIIWAANMVMATLMLILLQHKIKEILDKEV